MKKAPFRYGGVVRPPYFIDRERELEEMTLSLEGGANIILYSPRRYGKTSLIHRVAERLEEKGMTMGTNVTSIIRTDQVGSSCTDDGSGGQTGDITGYDIFPFDCPFRRGG